MRLREFQKPSEKLPRHGAEVNINKTKLNDGAKLVNLFNIWKLSFYQANHMLWNRVANEFWVENLWFFEFWVVLGFGPKLPGKVLVLGKTQKTQENDRSTPTPTSSITKKKNFFFDNSPQSTFFEKNFRAPVFEKISLFPLIFDDFLATPYT